MTKKKRNLDVSVRAGLTQGMVRYDERGRFQSRYHVTAAEEQKVTKYAEKYAAINRGFVAFVVSSNGYIGKGGRPLLKFLAARYAEKHYMKVDAAMKLIKMYISVSVVMQIATNCLATQAKIEREVWKRYRAANPLPEGVQVPQMIRVS